MEKQKLAVFQTFTENAENAMNFYAATLPGAVTERARYGKGHLFAGEDGKNRENKVLFGSISFIKPVSE